MRQFYRPFGPFATSRAFARTDGTLSRLRNLSTTVFVIGMVSRRGRTSSTKGRQPGMFFYSTSRRLQCVTLPFSSPHSFPPWLGTSSSSPKHPKTRGGWKTGAEDFFWCGGTRRLVVDDGSVDLVLRVPPHSELSSSSPPSCAARRGYKRRQMFFFLSFLRIK